MQKKGSIEIACEYGARITSNQIGDASKANSAMFDLHIYTYIRICVFFVLTNCKWVNRTHVSLKKQSDSRCFVGNETCRGC